MKMYSVLISVLVFLFSAISWAEEDPNLVSSSAALNVPANVLDIQKVIETQQPNRDPNTVQAPQPTSANLGPNRGGCNDIYCSNREANITAMIEYYNNPTATQRNGTERNQ